MSEEQKDFKAVKVSMKASQKQGEALSRSMLYSGINIFGQLTQVYMQNKQTLQSSGSNQNVAAQAMEADSSMMSISQEVLSIFKRLQKKDSVTKSKAFQELENYIEVLEADSEDLSHILTFFLYHFCRIILNEHDKKVREAAHHSLAAFIKKSKKKLGPHLKKIFSLWYCSFFDPSQEVALQAKKNFEQAFPEAKREQVFKMAYKNFLHFATEQLQQSEEAFGEGQSADLSKAQREDVFDRITSSVFLALSHSFEFTGSWSEEERQHFKKKLIDILDLTARGAVQEESKGVKNKKEKNNYLWCFLQSQFRGRVRSSCLQFISSFLQNLPVEVVEGHIQQIAPLVYGLVGDNNSILQTTFWRDAIFPLSKQYPQAWETINIKKTFLAKLNQTLKSSAFGAPVALYENFVKFASVFPFFHLDQFVEDKQNKASFKERCNIIREVLSSHYSGLKNDESVAFHAELLSSYYETTTFLLLKRLQPFILNPQSNGSDVEFLYSQLKKVIQQPLEDFISNYEKFQSKVQNSSRNIRFTIPTQQALMLTNLYEREANPSLMDKLIEMINESLISLADKDNSVRVIKALFKVAEKKERQKEMQSYLQEKVFMVFYGHVAGDMKEQMNDLGRQNIGDIQKKIDKIVRMLKMLNKFETEVSEDQWKLLDINGMVKLLEGICQKEELAKNALNQDDLGKFSQLKHSFIKSFTLLGNLHLASSISCDLTAQFTFLFQSSQLSTALKVHLLQPQSTFPFSFTPYFSLLQPECKALAFSFLKELIGSQVTIHQNWALLDSLLVKTLNKEASFLTEEMAWQVVTLVVHTIREIKQGSGMGKMGNYFQAIQSIVVTGDGNELTKDAQKLLFDKLLLIQSSNPSYKIIWKIFEEFMKKQEVISDIEFYNYCLESLRKELKVIISAESSFDLDIFNRFTSIVKKFVSLCPKEKKQAVIEDLLLQEENFSNLDQNSLPLKMFRDLFLSGGVGFDVTKLFNSQQGLKYVWLVCMLLNSKYLSSLSNFIQLKKQIAIFVETELIPSLVQLFSEGFVEFAFALCKYIKQKIQEKGESALSWVYTAEYFIKKMVDPGEAFSEEEKPVLKIDHFKEILQIFSSEIMTALIQKQEQPHHHVLTLTKLLRILAYYLIDHPAIQQLYEVSTREIKELIAKKVQPDNLFSVFLEVYLALGEYLGTQAQQEEFSIDILKFLFQNIENICSDDTNQTIINTTLEYSSYILNKVGLQKFKQSMKNLDFQSKFLDIIIACSSSHHLDPITYIYLLSLIRKTIGTELVGDKQRLINQVIEIAKEHALSFDMKMQKIQSNLKQEIGEEEEEEKEEKKGDEEEEEIDVQVQDFEYEMLQDLAETLLIFSSYVAPDLNENDLFLLIASGVESLQKASFVLLNVLYQNYIPTIKHSSDDEEQLKQLMAEQEEAKEEQDDEEEKKEEEKKAVHEKYKNILAFRNISEILIDLLENPPQIDQEGHELLQSNQVDQLVSGEMQEGCMNQKMFGYLLAWNALLSKIEHGRIKSQMQSMYEYQTVLGALNEYLQENFDIYQMLLMILTAFLPQQKKGLSQKYQSLPSFAPEYMDLSDPEVTGTYSVYTLVNFMRSFPSLARKFYTECDRKLQDMVVPYIKQVVSPNILENEIKKIEIAQSFSQGMNNELSFQLFKSTKEIFATYKQGEIEMQLRIQIPSDYPLRSVDVELTKQLKLQDQQLRKWILSIKKILQMQNGDIITAVLKWKENIEKETEGVEQCLICYCVVHDVDSSLPKMPCKTCKNKFHVACIRKWFQTSYKSNCPLCQNYFF